MKYRAVVSAGRNRESSFGQENRRIAERCVYLEASSPEQAAELAKAVVQAVYPEANVFEAYNVVDESELVSLRWDQVDLQQGLLHVTRRKHGISSVHPLRRGCGSACRTGRSPAASGLAW